VEGNGERSEYMQMGRVEPVEVVVGDEECMIWSPEGVLEKGPNLCGSRGD